MRLNAQIEYPKTKFLCGFLVGLISGWRWRRHAAEGADQPSIQAETAVEGNTARAKTAGEGMAIVVDQTAMIVAMPYPLEPRQRLNP
jgi:hypothetical protein